MDPRTSSPSWKKSSDNVRAATRPDGTTEPALCVPPRWTGHGPAPHQCKGSLLAMGYPAAGDTCPTHVPKAPYLLGRVPAASALGLCPARSQAP